MIPESKRRKFQAVFLFVLVPVGILGTVAELIDHPPDFGFALISAALTSGALALGVWLWRMKDFRWYDDLKTKAKQLIPRCRFQFSLRTLLIAVTALAVPLGYVGWQAKIVRQRDEAVKLIATLGGSIELFDDEWQFRRATKYDESTFKFRPPLVRRLLGDRAYFRVTVPHLSESEAQTIREAFPGIEIVVGRRYFYGPSL
jgi:hypothetical protein